MGDYYTNSRIFGSQNLEHHFGVKLQVSGGPIRGENWLPCQSQPQPVGDAGTYV